MHETVPALINNIPAPINKSYL